MANPFLLVGALCLGAILGFAIGMGESKPATGEYIFEQRYYADSLQYLEDIRNSNDDILAKCQ